MRTALVLRTSVNNTRNVIVLDPTLKMNEVDMSYKSFIVKFSGKIIKKIIKDKGWTITKAHNYLKSKFQYDEYIAGLMEEIIRESDIRIILNRNPTITFGSILFMKIRNIKKDADDMTLAIPSAILPGLTLALPVRICGNTLKHYTTKLV
jgi:DNA-directed RNA polymerase beta' subunit